jgi:sporadic carbohydrate cluster 2OG-Fe(II) oxygenase
LQRPSQAGKVSRDAASDCVFMPLTESFELDSPRSPQTSSLVERFLASGYAIFDVEDHEALDRMRNEIAAAAARAIDQPAPRDDGEFLDNIHRLVTLDRLNAFRLGIYREINAKPWFRPTYFRLGRTVLETLVGNELAMQNRINFSIQMPHDQTSLLDIHADVFSGETPYQVVQWLPFVDVAATKSMFILPRPKSEQVIARLAEFSKGGMRALYDAVEPDLVWLDIPYGKALVFCPNFLHGNVVNEAATTRWSVNCRFTGLFTPYDSVEKTLGSFYLPITVRPVTRLGMAYCQPTGFEE